MDHDWMNDERFSHFWGNYERGQAWYLNHQVAYWKSQALAADYENQQLHWLLQNVAQNQGRLEDLAHVQHGREATSDPPRDVENEDETFEMEISEEMLDFFAHSMKHKKERKEIDESNQVCYVNADEIPLEARSADIFGPCLPPGDRDKQEEYRRLYGDKGSRIRAMETAMQLTFHRYCDQKQPKLWPNMPLRL